MRIALAGPASLELLRHAVHIPPEVGGYPFPLTAQLAIEFANAGHDVAVISTDPDIDRPMSWRESNLSVRLVPRRATARALARDAFRAERRNLRAAIEAERPNVVHAHWTYEFSLAAQASKLPTLTTVHDWAPTIVRRLRAPYWWVRAGMQAWSLMRGQHFSAPSQYLARKVSRTYRKPCTVIANGIDLSSFARSGPIDRPGGRDRQVVGALNTRFSRLKNVQTALAAWAHVRDRHPTAELHLAGPDFALGGPAHEWALANGCVERVTFLGAISPEMLPMWYSSLDLFLHPSLEESFGLVLVEAMAAGIPVLAGRRSGAVPDVVGSGGILIDDIDDPQEVAAHLDSALSSPSVREAISLRAVEQASQFSLKAASNAYLEELYRIANLDTNAGGRK